MNIGKTKAYAILVFGAPMSGKTTFAEHFSDSLNAPFYNFPKLAEEYKVDHALALEILKIATKSKDTIIVEGEMDTEEKRKELRELFTIAGYKTVLIWVQTDLNAIKQRMRHHYKKLDEAKAALKESYENIEAPNENEEPLVISGKHTYQTQCKNVLGRLPGLKDE